LWAICLYTLYSSLTLIKTIFQIEDIDRDRINNIKENERKTATEDLEQWKEEQRRMAELVRF